MSGVFQEDGLAADTADVLAADTTDVLSAAKAASGGRCPAKHGDNHNDMVGWVGMEMVGRAGLARPGLAYYLLIWLIPIAG